jgi:circadian clock protein KaiC
VNGLGAFQQAAGNDPTRVSNFLIVFMHGLGTLVVTALHTLEIPRTMGPTVRTPIGDLSSLGENLILLRFVELRSRL